MMNNYKVIGCDTDSILFCKEDQTPFSEDQINKILDEINSLFPKNISWADDGYFRKVIVLKAKNYILFDGKKLKQKGSSLKSSTLEPALKEFVSEIIQTIIEEKYDYVNIYNKFIKEAMDIKDIKRWSSKKTITSTMLESSRANETKVLDAIKGSEYKEGDKVYVYFKEDDTLGLVENFDGCYNKDRMIEKVYKATKRFETILPIDELFLNFKLKRNKSKLEELLNE